MEDDDLDAIDLLLESADGSDPSHTGGSPVPGDGTDQMLQTSE